MNRRRMRDEYCTEASWSVTTVSENATPSTPTPEACERPRFKKAFVAVEFYGAPVPPS